MLVAPVTASVVGQRRWKQATEAMFDASQEVVHVITGNLKASGRIEVTPELGAVVGEVAYGGEVGIDRFVDYAEYEAARGGEHDYLLRAFLETEDQFMEAMGGIWDDVVVTWR